MWEERTRKGGRWREGRRKGEEVKRGEEGEGGRESRKRESRRKEERGGEEGGAPGQQSEVVVASYVQSVFLNSSCQPPRKKLKLGDGLGTRLESRGWTLCTSVSTGEMSRLPPHMNWVSIPQVLGSVGNLLD